MVLLLSLFMKLKIHCIIISQILNNTVEYHKVGKFGELTRFENLAKESWENYRSANKLLIVSANLDGFRLANCRRFTKFAKLSPSNFSYYTVNMIVRTKETQTTQ